MKQIELTSKIVLALIAIVAFSAMTVPAVVAQPGPPQGVGGGPPIPNGSITSEMIGDGEVQTQDIADGAVTSEKLAEGAGGVQLAIHAVLASVTIPPGEARSVDADCPSGELNTGGGYYSTSPNVNVWRNQPVFGDSWGASATNSGSQAADLTAFAMCLDTSP
jgi:hypothetical protein